VRKRIEWVGLVVARIKVFIKARSLTFPVLSLVKEMVLFTASRKLRCPSVRFDQVGEVESSKSAMYVDAPEFSPLITICAERSEAKRSEAHF